MYVVYMPLYCIEVYRATWADGVEIAVIDACAPPAGCMRLIVAWLVHPSAVRCCACRQQHVLLTKFKLCLHRDSGQDVPDGLTEV